MRRFISFFFAVGFLFLSAPQVRAHCLGETSTTANLGLCNMSSSASSANFFHSLNENNTLLDASSVGIQAPADGGTGAGVFTAGSVPFAGPLGVYAQDNANFFYKDDTDRLGLGQATPTGVLDVQTTDASEIVAVFGGAATPTTDLLRVQQAGVNRFSIDENAQVGVWQPNPVARLHVKGPSGVNDDEAIRVEDAPNAIIWESGNPNYRSSLGHTGGNASPFICLHCEHDTPANSWRNDDSGFAGVLLNGHSDELKIFVNNVSTAADNFSVATEVPRMTITQAGMTGLNTETPPARTLHISGNGSAMRIDPLDNAPTSPALGDIYVDESTELCFYDGTAWQGISTGTDANCV